MQNRWNRANCFSYLWTSIGLCVHWWASKLLQSEWSSGRADGIGDLVLLRSEGSIECISSGETRISLILLWVRFWWITYDNVQNLLSPFIDCHDLGGVVAAEASTDLSFFNRFLDHELHVLLIEWLLLLVLVRTVQLVLLGRTQRYVLVVLHLAKLGEHGIAKVAVAFNRVYCEYSCHLAVLDYFTC